jgi:hypothetical protein
MMVDLPMFLTKNRKCALNQIKITTENDTTSTEQIIIQTVTELY